MVLDLTPDPTVLEPIERASIDELRSLQLERMRWSLRHAYEHVPRYRRSFDEAGVHPDDLRELADLARFPFTTKQDLREEYPYGMFAVPREQVVRLHASSGTTGKPTVVGYTRRDIDTWAQVVARSLRAAGVRPGDGSSTSPTATGCSPGGSAPTTAPSGSAAPSSPSAAG
jgi:phenylacetate-CoA ligase